MHPGALRSWVKQTDEYLDLWEPPVRQVQSHSVAPELPDRAGESHSDYSPARSLALLPLSRGVLTHAFDRVAGAY